jgi:hypothetical protein
MIDQHKAFAEWLRRNPEPDLQELVERYGGFSKVPVEAWQEFDRRIFNWKDRYRRCRFYQDPQLSPLELERVAFMPEVERMTSLHAETIKRHYGHLLVHVSPRRIGMKIKDVLAIAVPRGKAR